MPRFVTGSAIEASLRDFDASGPESEEITEVRVLGTKHTLSNSASDMFEKFAAYKSAKHRGRSYPTVAELKWQWHKSMADCPDVGRERADVRLKELQRLSDRELLEIVKRAWAGYDPSNKKPRTG